MTTLLIALAVVVVFALALRAGLALVRRYTARYEAYAGEASKFYAAADRLVDNPNTPDSVLEFVELMNEIVNYRYAALFFVRVIQKQQEKPRKVPAFSLRTMPQDVVADFVIAFEAWVNAMAYRGMFWGPIFKAYLDSPSVVAKAKEVADRSHRKTLAHA